MKVVKLTGMSGNEVWVNLANVAYWRSTVYDAYGKKMEEHTIVVFNAVAGQTHEDGHLLELHVRETPVSIYCKLPHSV